MRLLKENDVFGSEQYMKIHVVNEELHGQTPLYWTVFHNNLDISKKLIEMGVDVNHNDSLGRSPLSISCFYGFSDLTRLLLKKGAVIDNSSRVRANCGWKYPN